MATPDQRGVEGRRPVSALDERRLRRVLARMLDEGRFLSSSGSGRMMTLFEVAKELVRRLDVPAH